jgi:tRNA uridine 5-carbamoylmethylation protein Kti12
MATATGKTRCVICDKEKTTFKCEGCSKAFCFNHLADHQLELNKQLDEIEVNRDLFRQSLTEQIEKPSNHTLMQQVDKWEHDSIKKIQQTANEVRQILLKNTSEYIHQVEIKLNILTNQLRQCRHENDFNEINLRQFEEELKRLTKELTKPSNIAIRQDSTPFISNISVDVSGKHAIFSSIDQNKKYIL